MPAITTTAASRIRIWAMVRSLNIGPDRGAGGSLLDDQVVERIQIVRQWRTGPETVPLQDIGHQVSVGAGRIPPRRIRWHRVGHELKHHRSLSVSVFLFEGQAAYRRSTVHPALEILAMTFFAVLGVSLFAAF